jgi:hypothetical protein
MNQIALPLLSLVDDQILRSEIAALLKHEQAERTDKQRETMDARVLAILKDAFDATDKAPVSIGTIAARFNAAHETEYGQSVSDKWIGHVVRKNLRLYTRRFNSVYVVPATENPKIDALAARYT